MEGGEGKRKIYLFCRSLTKLVEIAAWDDQRLDLGSIARAFELDPNSLKLNGHFIARGVDFVSSSVTWRSLLSFFSARGFSTGATGSDPLIVDGKLSKLGSKRMYDSTDSWVEACNADSYPNKKLLFQHNFSSCIKTRSRARDAGLNEEIDEPGKKVKLNLTNSDFEDTKNGQPPEGTIWGGESSWGLDKKVKRRDENLDLSNSCKRTRVQYF